MGEGRDRSAACRAWGPGGWKPARGEMSWAGAPPRRASGARRRRAWRVVVVVATQRPPRRLRGRYGLGRGRQGLCAARVQAHARSAVSASAPASQGQHAYVLPPHPSEQPGHVLFKAPRAGSHPRFAIVARAMAQLYDLMLLVDAERARRAPPGNLREVRVDDRPGRQRRRCRTTGATAGWRTRSTISARPTTSCSSSRATTRCSSGCATGCGSWTACCATGSSGRIPAARRCRPARSGLALSARKRRTEGRVAARAAADAPAEPEQGSDEVEPAAAE